MFADLFTFTEEVFKGKLFLCSDFQQKFDLYTKIFWTANFATEWFLIFTWQRPVKHLRWIILQESLTGFSL